MRRELVVRNESREPNAVCDAEFVDGMAEPLLVTVGPGDKQFELSAVCETGDADEQERGLLRVARRIPLAAELDL